MTGFFKRSICIQNVSQRGKKTYSRKCATRPLESTSHTGWGSRAHVARLRHHKSLLSGALGGLRLKSKNKGCGGPIIIGLLGFSILCNVVICSNCNTVVICWIWCDCIQSTSQKGGKKGKKERKWSRAVSHINEVTVQDHVTVTFTNTNIYA